MSVQFNRVKRSKYPLLVIGLGGTGTDALLAIKETFRTQFELPKEKDIPERTAYLAFDTDLCDLAYRRNGESKLTASETFTLNIPHGLNAMVIPSYVKEWFDTSKLQAGVNQPVKIDRQTARLALFWNADAVYDKLKTTIDQLIEETENGIKTLDVVFTTGISGGTGSGLFLDMAYLLQHLMKTEYPEVDCCSTAYIVMPSVSVDKIPYIDPVKKRIMEATGYAALKELDYWMGQEITRFKYIQRYSSRIEIEWKTEPFNNVILMDDKTEDGNIVIDAYQRCLKVISESVFQLYSHLESYDFSWMREFEVGRWKAAPWVGPPSKRPYMSIGIAKADDCHEKITEILFKYFRKRIEDVQQIDKVRTWGSRHSAPLLGKYEGEEFLEKFLPASTDYFGEFFNIMPDLGIFSDPAWTVDVVRTSPVIHEGYFNDWRYACALEAEKFAVGQAKQLRRRFRELVEAYATDLTYGPFTVAGFLKDADQGFVWFFNNIVEQWNTMEHHLQNEINNAFAEVGAVLYPEMANMSRAKAIIMGALGRDPAQKYFERCKSLFALERDYELAKYMAREIKFLQQEIKVYAESILPTFCNLLLQVSANIDSAVLTDDDKSFMLDYGAAVQLEEYVSKAFDFPWQDELAMKVIGCMIGLAHRVELDSKGSIIGLLGLSNEFESKVYQIVRNDVAHISFLNADQLLYIIGQGNSEQEKVDFVTNWVLPQLEHIAEPLLSIDKSLTCKSYPLVFVPANSAISYNGASQYRLIKQSYMETVEGIKSLSMIKLNNGIPLGAYTSLPMLEQSYEQVLRYSGVTLHLVQNEHINWAKLPSPARIK